MKWFFPIEKERKEKERRGGEFDEGFYIDDHDECCWEGGYRICIDDDGEESFQTRRFLMIKTV